MAKAARAKTAPAPPKEEKRGRGRPPGRAAKSVVPDILNQRGLAKFLGITEKWLSTLVAEGHITKKARGEFDFRASVLEFIKYREEHVRKRFNTPSSADSLRQKREEEIARKMAREDRQIITLDEALQSHDAVTGRFLESLSGLPARITRVPRERQRLEAIIDEERQRLADRFAEDRSALRTGEPSADPEAEDDT